LAVGFPVRGDNDGTGVWREWSCVAADVALDALITAGEAMRVNQILPDGFGVSAARERLVDHFA